MLIGTFSYVASMCCLCLVSGEIEDCVFVSVLPGDTKKTNVTGVEFSVTCVIDREDNVTYNESWCLRCPVLSSCHVA